MSIIKALIKYGLIIFTLVGIFFGSQETINYLVTPKHPVEIKVANEKSLNIKYINLVED